MDPQATWKMLLEARDNRDWPAAQEAAQTLLEWLDRGGFPPRIVSCWELSVDWDRRLARRACLRILDRVKKKR